MIIEIRSAFAGCSEVASICKLLIPTEGRRVVAQCGDVQQREQLEVFRRALTSSTVLHTTVYTTIQYITSVHCIQAA
jgi:hypothetical protein